MLLPGEQRPHLPRASRPARPKPGSALTAGAAPPSHPKLLAIWTPKLPIPTEKYGRPYRIHTDSDSARQPNYLSGSNAAP
jgi:hypothetical protein